MPGAAALSSRSAGLSCLPPNPLVSPSAQWFGSVSDRVRVALLLSALLCGGVVDAGFGLLAEPSAIGCGTLASPGKAGLRPVVWLVARSGRGRARCLRASHCRWDDECWSAHTS